jgi:hypothetical protein
MGSPEKLTREFTGNLAFSKRRLSRRGRELGVQGMGRATGRGAPLPSMTAAARMSFTAMPIGDVAETTLPPTRRLERAIEEKSF